MITLSITREQFVFLRAIHDPGSSFDSFAMKVIVNGQPKTQIWIWLNGQANVLL
jgi:hypothetical protein